MSQEREPRPLYYGDLEVEIRSDETVLEALLRAEVAVPNSCRNGSCQSCLVRCDGEVPAGAQAGLRETLKSQGYALACQCKASALPDEGLRVLPSDASSLFIGAMLTTRIALTPLVSKLVFELDEAIDYEPGQFVHLRRSDGLVRSYSVASAPGTPREVELHIGRVPGGKMSSFLLDELPTGERIDLRGPSGDCFYVSGREEQPLLLIATGTGLAPLLGIVRSALCKGHSGPIHLYHGSTTSDGTYLRDDLRALADRTPNLHYAAFVDDATPEELLAKKLTQGRASTVALAQHSDLKGWRVFLCGHPEMVRKTKKLCFLAGAAMTDILADPFDIASAG